MHHPADTLPPFPRLFEREKSQLLAEHMLFRDFVVEAVRVMDYIQVGEVTSAISSPSLTAFVRMLQERQKESHDA